MIGKQSMMCIVGVLLSAVVLTGCRSVHTSTRSWRDGSPCRQYSFYSSDDGYEIRHGTETFWNKNGQIIAQGVWKEGKPFDGICWLAAAGDAGSAGGLGHFEEWDDGVFVRKRTDMNDFLFSLNDATPAK